MSRAALLAFLAVILTPGLVGSQDTVFEDDFEWGSICAWSNPWFIDADYDTWGANGATGGKVQCPEPGGLAHRIGDCNDLEPIMFPGAFEYCDDLDNDCTDTTFDGWSEEWLDDPCDGTDTDLCLEGFYFCGGGAKQCSDETGDDLDVCDGFDNDCNPDTPDGSQDLLLGEPCDGPDSDLCNEGTYSACESATLVCSDTTDNTLELCNALDDDCDGSVDEDFDREASDPCLAGQWYIGEVVGEEGSGAYIPFKNHWSERWVRFRIVETDHTFIAKPLSARIYLQVHEGTDFDLVAYCDGCAASHADVSAIRGETAHTEIVHVRKNDNIFTDDSFDIVLWVNHISSSVCTPWKIYVNGGYPVANPTCD